MVYMIFAILTALIITVCIVIIKMWITKNDQVRFTPEQENSVKMNFESECEENETIQIVCPADYKNKNYYAVSDKRLFIKTGKLKTVPLENFVRIKMMNYTGNKTKDPGTCFVVKFTTFDGYSYSLTRCSDQFEKLLVYIISKMS